MISSFFVPEPLGKPEVDEINTVETLVEPHDKVLRLYIPINKPSLVNLGYYVKLSNENTLLNINKAQPSNQ